MENEQFQDIRRILIPLDGSKLSENALRYGTSIANKFGAEIILVSVYALKKSLAKKKISVRSVLRDASISTDSVVNVLC